MRSNLHATMAAAVVAFLLFGAAQAQQPPEKRVALVIGNGAYRATPSLPNPPNDARDMAETLSRLGFAEVALVLDATKIEMERAIRMFGRGLVGASAVVVFYAGHAVQINGRNYLLPIDALLKREQDLNYEVVDLGVILAELDQGKRTNIVILDACRDNPLAESLARSIAAAGRSVTGVGKGLARVESAVGTLIAYSTKDGTLASDGTGRNSPYTNALLKHIETPGLPVETMFKRVRETVVSDTQNMQIPWEYGSLVGDFYFNVSVSPPPAQPGSGISAMADREALFWQSAERSNRPEEYEAYLKQYPQGSFAALAMARVAALQTSAKQPQVAAAPAPFAVPLKPEVTVDPIDKPYVVTSAARMREAPDLKAPVLTNLKEGEQVHVLGKVKGQNWFQVERKGQPPGYVASTLLADAASHVRGSTQQGMIAPTHGGPTSTAGRTFRDCPECPEMVTIPGGSFSIGSPSGEEGRADNEGPQQSVSVRSFALGKYEVMRSQFAAFVGETGYNAVSSCIVRSGTEWKQEAGLDWRNPGFSQGDRDPVLCVNWDDAKAFVGWLSRKAGQNYRLPSEAEWEYAARAGTTAARHWGEDSSQACGYANVHDFTSKLRNAFPRDAHNCDDGHQHTAPVGSYRPNAFGLHDMLGNVWEWTEDCSNKSYEGSPRDGSAWTSGDCANRVLRGGSWYNGPGGVRSAGRGGYAISIGAYFGGFRVARTN